MSLFATCLAEQAYGNHLLCHLIPSCWKYFRFYLLQIKGYGWGFFSKPTSALACFTDTVVHNNSTKQNPCCLDLKEEYNSAHTCAFSFSSKYSSKIISKNNLAGNWNLLESRRMLLSFGFTNALERNCVVWYGTSNSWEMDVIIQQGGLDPPM